MSIIGIPDSISNAASEACNSLLPSKSKGRYDKAYKCFTNWRLAQAVEGITEEILLAYFYGKIKNNKSSTIWSTYSMLKSTILIYENIDIAQYKKLIALLKRTNDDYVSKKSKILTTENMEQFLKNANDDQYLLMKVILIFSLNGACRQAELHKIRVTDITDTETVAVVNLNDTKTKKHRFFTITNDCSGYDLYNKYLNLRPNNIKHDSFFILYHNSQCTIQKVGINTLRSIPKKIAEYLQLTDSNLYTGHCFRRTSATLLADTGVDVQVLKRHGGWRSTTTAEGYVEENVQNKMKISKKIFEFATTTESTNNDEIDEQSSFDNIKETKPVKDNDISRKPLLELNAPGTVNISYNNGIINIYNIVK